ncbi:MAG: M23 family metallopeptidase [Candidatus Krumholzibacteriia bacterium]
MKLRRRYSFLYLPADDGRTRELHVSRAVILGVCAVLGLLVAASALFAVDVSKGVAWRPGGSPVVRQNLALQAEVDRFEDRVASMQSDLDEVFTYQQALAAAVDITPLDDETRAAGIGGRQPLVLSGELSGLRVSPDLDRLVRQARIQRSGMAAILDSLSAREGSRDHMPSIRPCDVGWLSSRFGKRVDPFTGKLAFHRGIDFSVPVGTPVRVTADGVVTAVEKQRGLGRLVKVDHGNGIVTVYGHLQETKVKRGQRVSRGEVVALSGNSGRSTAPHLHYEVRVAGCAVNPMTYVLDTYADLH